MTTCAANRVTSAGIPPASWRELVWPREHGSWSLVLEPLAFGLLVAPSGAGACLAAAALAGFFARRPLRTAVNDPHAERRAAARRPLGLLAATALGFFLAAGASASGGVTWLAWLLPALATGAVFLHFDLRAAGREEAAEIAGAAAFAWLPAVLATLAGWHAPEAAALALVLGGRAVPTVLAVRAALRAQKTGQRRPAPAVAAAWLAVAGAVGLMRAGLAPRLAVILLAVLAVRATALLVWPRPALRARTLGMVEAVLGAIFIFALAFAWRG